MKILFSDWTLPYLLKDANFPVGGWAVELGSWIYGLEAAGCEVEVLTWIGARDYVGEASTVKLREAYRLNSPGIPVLKYFYHHIPAIAAATRRAAPDVVIQACAGVETSIMAIAARYAGATYVHRLASDCDVDERLLNTVRPYQRLAFRWGIRRTDAIICQNSYQRERVRSLYPGTPATVIHNPFRPVPGLGRPEKDPRAYVAWIANFGPAKNLPLLQRVAVENPEIQFRVAGALSRLATAATLEAVEALKVLPNVTMVGYLSREAVSGFIGRAKYLLSTSLFEGMSNTFLEALAVGTPIICPARVDPDNIVARFQLGFTAIDDDELCGLLSAAFRIGNESYEKLAGRCFAYVREANNPQQIAETLLSFLGEACKAKTRHAGLAA